MRKITVVVLGIALLACLLVPAQSFADDQPIVVQGKVVQERTLVPLRSVSAGLGAEVSWDQKSKIVTIVYRGTVIVLPLQSQKVMVNDNALLLDVPAQIDQGVTYVPIRFISQTLGGTITWNTSNRTADILLDNKEVRVVTEATFNWSNIPQKTVDNLIDKVNKATDLTSISQIRTYFNPYFTDKFINQIIGQKGLKYNVPFTDRAYVNTEGTTGTIRQTSSEADTTLAALERTIVLKYSQGNWKVDSVFFTPLSP